MVLDDGDESLDLAAFDEFDGDGTSPSIVLPEYAALPEYAVLVTAPRLEIVSDDEVATALLTPLQEAPAPRAPVAATVS